MSLTELKSIYKSPLYVYLLEIKKTLRIRYHEILGDKFNKMCARPVP